MLKLNFRKQLSNFRLQIDYTITQKVTAVLGPSGSGKSTLLNCISGIMHPEAGEIVFLDQTLYASQSKIQIPPEKRRFGYVFQEGYLFPHLTVQRNIFYGHPHRLRSSDFSRFFPHRWTKRRAETQAITSTDAIDTDQVIDILEIRDLLKRYPKQLSVGQRQRVAIARALASCPQMLLMDEPLAALDTGLKNRILPYLHHIKQAFDIPILYVTHSIPEAMALADEVLCLSDGRLTAHGEPHELLAAPSALPIAQMTGVENILSLPVVESHEGRGTTVLAIGNQRLVVPYTEIEIGRLMPVAIRAADIIVSLDCDMRMSARNILRGTIRQIEAYSGRTILSVEIEEHPLSVKITNEARNQLHLVEGMACYFIIKANAVNLLWKA